MILIKFNINSQAIEWARRFGSTENDRAKDLAMRFDFIYLVGSSDSTGWTSSQTDIVVLKIDPDTSDAEYGKYIGGNGEDTAIKVEVDSANMVYILGEGFSNELSNGSKDIFIMRMSSGGTLSYFYNFGGADPEDAIDMKIWGDRLYVLGSSISDGLKNGFYDIFVIACSKNDPSSVTYVKYVGTVSYEEHAKGLAVKSDGSLIIMGDIEADGFTNGNMDVFIA